MKPRRQTIPPKILEKLKKASAPPNEAVRFSKRQLLKMGLSYNGGGLVSINGKVYAFVATRDKPNKSYILGEGEYGKVKLLQNIEDSEDKKVLKVLLPDDDLTIPTYKLDNFKRELLIAAILGRGFSGMIKKEGENGR